MSEQLSSRIDIAALPDVERFLSRRSPTADNERYRIFDYELGDLTLSLTIMKPMQETRGHSHEDTAEVYYFTRGSGEMIIGEKTYRFSQEPGKNVALVPQGAFHKVRNPTTAELAFVAVFKGKRTEANRFYK